MAINRQTLTKRAKCPRCGEGFTFKVTRPKRYCTIACQSAAANMRTNARRRIASSTAAQSARGVVRSEASVLRSEASFLKTPRGTLVGVVIEDPFLSRPIASQSALPWMLGRGFGGVEDRRVNKARLYPADKDPHLYSHRWAYAVHLTDHRYPNFIGWYGLVKGRDDNAMAFMRGPLATAEEARTAVEGWLHQPGAKTGGDNGAFVKIVCGAPHGAAVVARGL